MAENVADINSEELRRAIEDLTEAIRQSGAATGAKGGPGIFDGLSKSTDKATKSLKALDLWNSRLGKSFYNGTASATTMADALDESAFAATALGAKFGKFGAAMGLAGGLLIKYFTASARQADKLYKGFQDLTRVGAGTSQGIQDVRASLRDFGLGVDDTAKLFALFEKGAQDFAILGGNVAKGSKAVGAMTRGIIGDDGLLLQMRNIGENVDTIGESAIAYAALQARLGMTEQQMSREGAKALQAYIEQQNILTKVTGATAKEQQAAQARAMNIEQFRAKNMQLIAEGRRDEAEKDMQVFKNLSALDPSGALAEAFATMKSGFIAPGTGLAAVIASGGEAFDIANDSTLSAAKQTEKFAQSFKGMTGPGGALFNLAQVGKFKEVVGLDFGALQDAILRSPDFAKRMAEATDEVERQKIRQEAATKAMGAVEIANMRTRDNLQAFVAEGIVPATIALQGMAAVVREITGALPGGARRTLTEEQKAADAANYARMTPVQKAGSLLGPRLFETIADYVPGMGGIAKEAMNARIKAESQGAISGLAEKIIQVESGNRNIGNIGGTSSAFGLPQFTKGTFEGLVAKAGTSNPLYGKTWEDYKKDTNLQREALNQLIDENRQALAKRGLSTSDAAIYLAHFLGAGGASRVLSLPDSADIRQAVGEDQIAANQSVFAKVATVGDLKKWADQKMGQSGYQFGGVATGPRSGYSTVLHGTEAVVPLPNGRTIPVEMSGMQVNMDRQLGIMGEQLAKLDQLVSAIREQTSVSQRILQVSQA